MLEPENIFFWLDGNCNLRCRHCDIWKSKESKTKDSKIPMERLEKLKEGLGKGFTLNIVGGEPLMNPNTFKVASWSKKHGIDTSINTNGTLIDKIGPEKIVGRGFKHILVSMDFPGSDDHDKHRGREGVFKKAISGVKNIIEARKNNSSDNPKIYFNTTIMKPNQDKLLDIVDLSRNIGVDGIAFQAIAPKTFFSDVPAPLQKLSVIQDRLRPPTYVRKPLEGIWDKIVDRDVRNELWPDNVENELSKLKKIASKDGFVLNKEVDFFRFKEYFKDPSSYSKSFRCATHRRVDILENGDVKLCRRKPSIGNIDNGNIQDILRSDFTKKIVQEIKECNGRCNILCPNKPDFYW